MRLERPCRPAAFSSPSYPIAGNGFQLRLFISMGWHASRTPHHKRVTITYAFCMKDLGREAWLFKFTITTTWSLTVYPFGSSPPRILYRRKIHEHGCEIHGHSAATFSAI